MRLFVLAVLCGLAAVGAAAQSIVHDTTFRSVLPDRCTDLQPTIVHTIVPLADGHVIVLGSFRDNEADSSLRIVVLDARGRYVPTYVRDARFARNTEEYLLQRSDGLLSVLTTRTSQNANVIGCFVVGVDGTLQAESSRDSVLNGFIWDASIGPDDAVFVGGRFLMPGTNVSYGCAKILANGTADPTWARPRINRSGARAMAVAADGSVYLGGNFDTVGTYRRTGLVRLLPNGEVDPLFNVVLDSGQYIIDVFLQPEKGLVVIGRGPGYADSGPLLRRYRVDGTIDPTFAVYDTTKHTPVQLFSDGSDGFFIVGNYFESTLQRANVDGQIDTTFVPPYIGGYLNEVVSHNAKVFLGGDFRVVDGRSHPSLMALDGRGGIDHEYNLPCAANPYAASITRCKDGTLVLGSPLVNVDTTTLGPTIAVDRKGALRAEYRQRGLLAPYLGSMMARKVQQLQDARLLVYDNNRGSQGWIYRLLPNGERDTTYRPPVEINGSIIDVSLLDDGQAYIVWATRMSGAPAKHHLARLDANGQIDATFSTGMGIEGTVTGHHVLPDGRMYLAGNLTSYNGTNVETLIRLKVNGELDESFSTDITLGSVPGTTTGINHIAVDSEDRIIIAGRFDNVNGRIYANVARLRTNGTLDLTFAPDIGSFTTISKIVIDAKNRVIVAGNFTIGETKGIARCAEDGSLDPTFTVDLDGVVLDILAVGDDTLYAAGTFQSIGGRPHPAVARFLMDQSTSVNDARGEARIVHVAPNPATDIITITVDEHSVPVMVSITDVRGVVHATYDVDAASLVIPTTALSSGVYVITCSAPSWLERTLITVTR